MPVGSFFDRLTLFFMCVIGAGDTNLAIFRVFKLQDSQEEEEPTEKPATE